jgi:riboflavin kinase / FMN adenylyltransferase
LRAIRSYRDVPAEARGGVLAIGNFDGVHRGHQAVVGQAMRLADGLGAPPGVLMFEPHPRLFFQPEKPLFTLTPLEEKLRLFGELGLCFAAVLPFDASLASLEAHQFVHQVLLDGFAVRHVVVGHDFNFGRGRAGNWQLLADEGQRGGFGVTSLEAIGDGLAAFSSSRIRGQLREGDVAGAALALGHWWRITGKVIGGSKRGAGLGFPTANIEIPAGVELKHGIYAARVVVDGSRHAGAAYLGTRPTFDNGRAVLETFIFDFDEQLYGREIAVELMEFLRPDQAFQGIEALKAQMVEDCRRARVAIAAIERDNPLAPFPLGGLAEG